MAVIANQNNGEMCFEQLETNKKYNDWMDCSRQIGEEGKLFALPEKLPHLERV